MEAIKAAIPGTKNIEWRVDPSNLSGAYYHPELGALVVPCPDAVGPNADSVSDAVSGMGADPARVDPDVQTVRVVLFRAVPKGDKATQTHLRPIVEWEHLPPERQTFNRNAKGAGAYLGTNHEAVEPFKRWLDGEVAVFATPPVRWSRHPDRSEILDRRDRGVFRDVKVVVRQLGRLMMSKLRSPKYAVDRIDASYDAHQARGVLLTPAPSIRLKGWLARLREAGVRGAFTREFWRRPPFPPGWLLWRDVEAPLDRIGVVVPSQPTG